MGQGSNVIIWTRYPENNKNIPWEKTPYSNLYHFYTYDGYFNLDLSMFTVRHGLYKFPVDIGMTILDASKILAHDIPVVISERMHIWFKNGDDALRFKMLSNDF